MKKIFVLIIAALCFYTSSAQVESEFDNYVKNQRSAIDSLKVRYEHDIDLLEKEYEEYIKAERDAYNKFIKEKKAIWGNDNVVETTNTEWVEYSKDGKSRSVVDFEEGEATIEIIITPEEEKSEDVVEKKIEDKLKELIINKGKTKDYDTQQEKARDLQDTPILEEQIETPSGEIVTKDNLDEGVKEIAKEADLIIFSMGSLYTSILPHLICPDVANAINKDFVHSQNSFLLCIPACLHGHGPSVLLKRCVPVLMLFRW